MADLYGRWVPDEWISQVHQACIDSPQWDYLMLTKFPARYLKLDLPPTAWLGTSVDKQDRVRIAETAFRQIDGVAVKSSGCRWSRCWHRSNSVISPCSTGS